MEHKKKKNEPDRSDRNVFIGIGITCLIGLFVLLYAFNAFTRPNGDSDFGKTTTAIVATNNAVATLLEQTKIAATERSNVTSTAIWTSIVSTSLAATKKVNLTLTAAEKDIASSTKPEAVTTEQFMLTSTPLP
jgi:hypothetical protein